jgi:hypothetical protein
MAETAGGVEAQETDEVREKRFDKPFEVIIAVLLGLAAIGTAYAAYMTDLRDGDALKSFQEGNRIADRANQQLNEVSANRNEDQIVSTFAVGAVVNFTFQSALAGGDLADKDAQELANDLINQLGSDDLIAANKACNKDPECTVAPIDSEHYVVPAVAEAERLDKEADRLFADANANDEKGDNYSLITVILATALFLYGVAAVARARPVKLGTAGLGATIFTVSMVMLIGA